jgi:hypothetical protein
VGLEAGLGLLELQALVLARAEEVVDVLDGGHRGGTGVEGRIERNLTGLDRAIKRWAESR